MSGTDEMETLAREAAKSAALFMGMGLGDADGAWVDHAQYDDVLEMIRYFLGLREAEGIERTMKVWGVEETKYGESVLRSIRSEWVHGSGNYMLKGVSYPDMVAYDTFRDSDYGWMAKVFASCDLESRLEAEGVSEWGVFEDTNDSWGDARKNLFWDVGWMG